MELNFTFLSTYNLAKHKIKHKNKRLSKPVTHQFFDFFLQCNTALLGYILNFFLFDPDNNVSFHLAWDNLFLASWFSAFFNWSKIICLQSSNFLPDGLINSKTSIYLYFNPVKFLKSLFT